MLFAPEALPIASGATEPMTAFCAAGMRHRDAAARDDERGRELARRASPGSATSAIQPIPAACSVRPVTSGIRSPMRSASTPATGATKKSVAVQGRSRSPAPSGPWPSPVWRNCARKNTAAKSEANMRKIAALPAENARRAEHRQGQHRGARPGLPGDERGEERQAGGERAQDLRAVPPRRVAAHEPPDDRRARRASRASGRARSSDRSAPVLSGMRARASGIATSPIGTLTQKIQLHAMPSAIAPPTTGPVATARPVRPWSAPMAAPRRSARERGADEGEGERHDERRAGALHGARRDEPARRRGEGARGGREGEDDEARRRTAGAGRGGRPAPTPS